MSETVEVAKEVVKEVAGVSEKVIDKGFALLDQIAAKLGLTVDYLWPFMVKEQIVQFVVSCLLFVTGVAGMVVVNHYLNYGQFNDGGTSSIKSVVLAIIGVIFAVAAVFGFIELWANLPGFLNPEYHALRDLMRMVR